MDDRHSAADGSKSAPEGAAVQAAQPEVCCNDFWEEAYCRFETPEMEIRKFMRRLQKLGAAHWLREARVVEICCGRGNGLRALERLGFSRLEGVDLSATLLKKYAGPAQVFVGDCRRLPFENDSRDLVLVQGGLHHLSALPEDLAQTLAEACRVLRPGGRFVAVEPWRTPFLSLVHAFCRSRIARRLSPRIDALATMARHEERTYQQWLERPGMIVGLLKQSFSVECCSIAWGKLLFVGRKGDRR